MMAEIYLTFLSVFILFLYALDVVVRAIWESEEPVEIEIKGSSGVISVDSGSVICGCKKSGLYTYLGNGEFRKESEE